MPRSSATAIVERQQRRRRGVDGHRHRHLVERDAVEQDVHVLDRRDRDAGAPDLAARQRVVGVAAHLRRQIERDRQPGLPRREQELVAPVRLLGGAEAGVLAHRPRLAPVHGGVDAARERERARPAQVARRIERRLARRQAVRRRRPARGCGTLRPAVGFRRGRRRRVAHADGDLGDVAAHDQLRPRLRLDLLDRDAGRALAQREPLRRHVDHRQVGDDPVHGGDGGQRQRALRRGSSSRRPWRRAPS